MAGRAKVTSLDALDTFAAALRVFSDEAARALEGIDVNVRKAVDWIGVDRKAYWKGQLQRSEQRAHEAKLNLQRAQTFRRVDDYRPSCIEEKREWERARRRVEVCRQQVEAVRHWSRVVDRAVYEYEGGASQLARWLETDVDRAVAAMDRLRRTLEAYVTATPSAEVAGAVDSLPAEYVPPEPPPAAQPEGPPSQADVLSEEEPDR